MQRSTVCAGSPRCVVFAIHVWIYQLPNTVELRRDSWEKTLLFEGRVAFVMFFVLSGYLLYRAFARAALGRSAPVAVGSYLVRRAARITPAYYVALAGTLSCWPGRRRAGAPAGGRGRATDVLPLRAELLARHAAEAECRHVDVDRRGRLLPAAAADRAGRAAARPQPAPPGRCCSARSRLPAWHGTTPTISPAGVRLPPTRRSSFLPYFACGMLVALLVEMHRARDGRRARHGRERAASSPARRRSWWPTASGMRTATTPGLAMEVFADSAAAVAFAAVIAVARARHRDGRALDGLRARSPGWARSPTASTCGTSRCSCSRAAPACCPRASCSDLVVLPVAIAFGAASWYVVERPLMHRAARLPPSGAERGHRRPGGAGAAPLSAARSGRSRSRTRARSGTRPASSSGRAAARTTVTGTLPRGHAALDRLDHELRGVELLLAQHELRQHAGAHRAVAVRAVADLGARDERHEAVEEHDAHLAREVVRARRGRARVSRARRRPRRRAPGATSRDISSGRCWPSASSVTTTSALGVGRQPVAGAQRRAAAAVDHVARDGGSVGARDVAGARRASRRRRPAPRSRRRTPWRGCAAAPRRCCPPRCRPGSRPPPCRGSAPGRPGEAELLPRDALEHRGQLAIDPAGERHVAQRAGRTG